MSDFTPSDPEAYAEEVKKWTDLLEGVQKKELFSQEASGKVYELSKGKSMFEKILKEFTFAQFMFGGCTMNIDMARLRGDEALGTAHFTVRAWGKKLMACPSEDCRRVRERVWLLADQGWAVECPGHCGVVIQPLGDQAQQVIEKLSAIRAMGRLHGNRGPVL